MSVPPTGENVILSIIIPIYNVESYLEECLQSVLDQDDLAVEVIMVSDYSTDSSLQIAMEYKGLFHRGRIIEHSANRGLGPARNSGIEHASGQYLLLLDSDDWLAEDAIERVITLISGTSFDIAHFGCNRIASGNIEYRLFTVSHQQDSTVSRKLKLLTLPNYAWLKVYSKKFIDTHDLKFNNIFYEDIPWTMTASIEASKIIFVDIAICNYRLREDSITHTKSYRHIELLTAYEIVLDRYKKIDIEPVIRKAIEDAFFKAVYYFLRNRKKRLGTEDLELFIHEYERVRKNYSLRPNKFKSKIAATIIRFSIFHLKLFP